MASLSFNGISLLELLDDTNQVLVPELITGGTSLLELLDDVNLASTGVVFAGSSLIELDDTSTVVGTGAVLTLVESADIEFFDTLVLVQSGAVLVGSSLLEFTDTHITILSNKIVGECLLEFEPAQIAMNGGTAAVGSALLEFFDTSVQLTTPLVFTGESLIELFYEGVMTSNVPEAFTNPSEMPTLDLPIVAFSMNVRTRGVTAYTDNVGEEVHMLIATPISQLGSPKRKYVPDLYAHLRSSGDVVVSVVAGETTSIQRVSEFSHDGDMGMKRRRAKLPKGIFATNWQFFLENQDGADVQVVTIEPSPAVSTRTI